jgi:hypothetical protein
MRWLAQALSFLTRFTHKKGYDPSQGDDTLQPLEWELKFSVPLNKIKQFLKKVKT